MSGAILPLCGLRVGVWLFVVFSTHWSLATTRLTRSTRFPQGTNAKTDEIRVVWVIVMSTGGRGGRSDRRSQSVAFRYSKFRLAEESVWGVLQLVETYGIEDTIQCRNSDCDGDGVFLNTDMSHFGDVDPYF